MAGLSLVAPAIQDYSFLRSFPMNLPIRVTVWNEFRHERQNDEVRHLYPDGIHATLAAALARHGGFEVRTATLDESEHGLSQSGLVQRNVGGGYQFEAELYVEREGCPCDVRLHPPASDLPTPMTHFVDAILNGTPHLATGEEGGRVMDILDAIYESAATGEPVRPAK